MTYDHERAEAAVRELLIAMGYDPTDPAIRDTPRRVAGAMHEATSGRHASADQILLTTFEADYDQVILLRDIPFYSTCEHHLLPFYGVAHVAYVPKTEGGRGRVVGLSKLARLVDMHARRLQLQERLTRDVATDLERILEPLGVSVIVEGQHMCMCSRGVMKAGSLMKTSVMRGCFRTKGEARSELMALLR